MNPKSHQLIEKERTNQGFRLEMEKASQNYNRLKKLAHYSNLTTVNEILVSKFQAEKTLAVDTYFIYGVYINQQRVSMDLITSYFVTVFPKPKKPYIFVYFNDFDSNNNFSNFRNMLSLMPIQYFVNLQAIFLVRPSLKMKASRYFTFGTISKYINNKTINVGNMHQLSSRLNVRQEEILKFLPLDVRNYFSQQQTKAMPVYHLNTGQKSNSGGYQISRTTSKNSDTSPTMIKQGNMTMSHKPVTVGQNQHMMMTSTSVKGQNQPNSLSSNPNANNKQQIDEYTKSQRGIPELFEILLVYFLQHHEQLQSEGIFRKSVSIQEQTIALQKMNKKEYDYLEKVRDPHLVANLIKRFLSKLKTPIIPYKIFEQLMQAQPLDTFIVAEKMKELSEVSNTKYLTLMSLLDFMIRKVIPRSHKNKMVAQNIAICFAPCLMWAEHRSIKDLTYINKSVGVVNLMLTNFQSIFGTKKQIQKVYRSSYFLQQRKSIAQTYNIEKVPENVSLQDQRKTPNFGLLILQKAQNEQKILQQHQDLSDNQIPEVPKKTHLQVNIISPNKSSSKSQAQKKQLKQDQQQLQRKSDRSLKKENNKEIYLVEPPSCNSVKKRGIFSSKLQSPKSGNLDENIKDRVSSNKSNQQINSIHSDH